MDSAKVPDITIQFQRVICSSPGAAVDSPRAFQASCSKAASGYWQLADDRGAYPIDTTDGLSIDFFISICGEQSILKNLGFANVAALDEIPRIRRDQIRDIDLQVITSIPYHPPNSRYDVKWTWRYTKPLYMTIEGDFAITNYACFIHKTTLETLAIFFFLTSAGVERLPSSPTRSMLAETIIQKFLPKSSITAASNAGAFGTGVAASVAATASNSLTVNPASEAGAERKSVSATGDQLPPANSTLWSFSSTNPSGSERGKSMDAGNTVDLLNSYCDGPLLRSRISALEKKTSTLKQAVKRVLKQSAIYLEASRRQDEEYQSLVNGITQIPFGNQSIKDYLEASLVVIREATDHFHNQIQNLILDPLSKLYANEIKKSESRKKDFDQESSEFDEIERKYLATKTGDRTKKKSELDTKYHIRRNQFDLKRFDYCSSLSELHGPHTETELAFIFINFAKKQHLLYQIIHTKLDDQKQLLDKLTGEVSESTKTVHHQRKEREELRKLIENRGGTADESGPTGGSHSSPKEESRGNLVHSYSVPKVATLVQVLHQSSQLSNESDTMSRRKEGFLFATTATLMNVPGVIGPAQFSWKKFWCVLSGGQLQEYTNWTKQLEPSYSVHLRLCTVREARKVDRRFCFELIGPHIGRRIYQATDAEELKSWIQTIQRSIESLLAGTGSLLDLTTTIHESNGSNGKSAGSELQMAVLNVLRDADPQNHVCADCGARGPDWASINLGCLICIECSGTHRSLGTHISKVRSLTLDTASWTPELIYMMCAIGNTLTNEIWEGAPSAVEQKPKPSDRREAKAAYIQDKYVARKFIKPYQPIALADPPLPLSSDDMLVEAIREGNLTTAMWAMALGADLNKPWNGLPLLHMALGYPLIPSAKSSESTTAIPSHLTESPSVPSVPSTLSLGPMSSTSPLGPPGPQPPPLLQNAGTSLQLPPTASMVPSDAVLSNPSNLSCRFSIIIDQHPLAQSTQRFIMAEFLIQNGASVNACDDLTVIARVRLNEYANLPNVSHLGLLHYACLYHDYECLSYLLSKGAEPKIQDNCSLIPAFYLSQQTSAYPPSPLELGVSLPARFACICEERIWKENSNQSHGSLAASK
ncbi:uncharacterized protein BJ171DRAFT_600455 [Polychytrium aggregatum]|uniref:uncharacterized protein n=1 Tax=Polychytrium aggregatum TaxID=110093 RepID=UPI0022FE5181|nr:uncharacterized protein BJ171DRAFT_600455 [Polychytrium aggregatum]KAI9203011.1 hypothetical protein BJ171DRAFT_600455 [Polychytrium aggregatum]